MAQASSSNVSESRQLAGAGLGCQRLLGGSGILCAVQSAECRPLPTKPPLGLGIHLFSLLAVAIATTCVPRLYLRMALNWFDVGHARDHLKILTPACLWAPTASMQKFLHKQKRGTLGYAEVWFS
jgi:hypothetical protein